MLTHSPPRTTSVDYGSNTFPNPFQVQRTMQTQSASAEISASSVKLPAFWQEHPEAWFVHFETQFASKSITLDNTKYEYLVISLSQEVIMTVLDVIQNPPISNKYDNLKRILIERYSLSETKRFEKILYNAELGDLKPSELYRSLLLLAGSDFNTEFLKKLWLQKLPKNLNVALISSRTTSILEMVKLADELWEVVK